MVLKKFSFPANLLLTFLLLRYIFTVATRKVGENLVAKRGRPKSENSMDYMLRVRMDKDTLEKLDKCCEASSLSRSEVVRKGIEEQYGKIKK